MAGPDTHLNSLLERDYKQLEMQRLFEKAESDPARLAIMSRQDVISCFGTVYSDVRKHEIASRFGVENMIRCAFDGSENTLANPKLKEVWDELGMDDWRAQTKVDMDAEFTAGHLPWTPETLEQLVELYPKRGKLDEYTADHTLVRENDDTNIAFWDSDDGPRTATTKGLTALVGNQTWRNDRSWMPP